MTRDEVFGPSHSHCITCSDEGVPMQVVELDGDDIALCVDPELPEAAPPIAVMVDLVGDRVAAGDLLLVHAGVALACLPASSSEGTTTR